MHTDQDIWINVYDEHDSSIVRMRLGDVAKRITAWELPGEFGLEAVKALAIAVRTSVVKKLKMFDGVGCIDHKGADMCSVIRKNCSITDMESLKTYLGDDFEKLYNLASAGVDNTSGLIAACMGKPIAVEYHLSCGGGTENSEDVLGNRIIYLRKVLCKYCSNSPKWESSVDIPVSEIEEKLGVKIIKGSSVSGPEINGVIEDVEREETGRIKSIKIGGKYFTGIEVKNMLGLNSSRFGWDPLIVRFKVRGCGDGLGMCLYGADAMAKEGKTCDEILKYYYTNITIENIDSRGDGLPLKGRVFIVDPGHGGEPGDDEKGSSGLREKDVNLDIARRLAGYLRKEGAEVLLTREEDIDIPLPKRVEMSNNIRPNFLISIHQNSFFSPGVSGTEVYYYRGDNEGEKIGRAILENIVRTIGTSNRGVRTADFYLLRESKVSSILIECMYITNPKEEQRLKDEGSRDEVAKSIYRGILDYYGI